MIDFAMLPLSEDILEALSELKIDYVFQPIFCSDAKTVYAREALMRPKNMTVTELIDRYEKMDKLHVIEVATFFGALQAYENRGYKEWVAINSFPSECMTDEEAEALGACFGDVREKMIIEMLEYPALSMSSWEIKNKSVKSMDNLISLDDYGTGINDISKVELLMPDIVKLDRSLISNIDKDSLKQENCKSTIDKLHSMNRKVVAEGIETKEELDILISLGADLYQGYYLGMPE